MALIYENSLKTRHVFVSEAFGSVRCDFWLVYPHGGGSFLDRESEFYSSIPEAVAAVSGRGYEIRGV